MGTVGIIGLSLGGVLGSKAIHRDGADYWKWWMASAMTIPDLLYVFLSYALPDSLMLISICVFIEQFGYGFGIIFYLHCLNVFSSRSAGNIYDSGNPADVMGLPYLLHYCHCIKCRYLLGNSPHFTRYSSSINRFRMSL